MAFFTNLNSWTKSLYLITISKRIDLKRSAWRHFVDNELYFQFPLNFSQFPFVRYVFYAFKDRTKSTEYLQLTDYGDAHFKLLPFLNELSYNFLLGLDLKNFRRSFKRSLIFCIFIESKPPCTFFLPMVNWYLSILSDQWMDTVCNPFHATSYVTHCVRSDKG